MLFYGLTLTSLFALLALSVRGTPLSRRDVIAPKITNPHDGTVWPVGSVQTVTWDTSNFPPDSQITNPIGKVILGFNESDSLNLDFDHPLAQNFKLRDGSVNITVPGVQPRDDYLIVLFGDSGNTSPAFAITKIAGTGSSSSSSSSTSVTTSGSLITTPIPITGSSITGGSTSTSSSVTSTPTDSSISPTPTSPIPSSSSGSSSSATDSLSVTSSTSAPSSAASQTQGSAALSVHAKKTANVLLAFGMVGMATLIF